MGGMSVRSRRRELVLEKENKVFRSIVLGEKTTERQAKLPPHISALDRKNISPQPAITRE